MEKTSVLIVGGGLAGLTTAVGLSEIGLDCIIIDPGSLHPDETLDDNRTTAHLMPTVRLFKSLKLWDGLADQSASLRSMRLIDVSSDPRVEVMFDAPEIGENQFGYNLSNAGLKRQCLKRLNADNSITRMEHVSARQLDLSPPRPIVTLESGDKIQADLIIAADGASSPMRRIAGIETNHRDHHQTALTTNITHTIPHHHISTEFHRPHGPLTIVPLPTMDDTYSSSIVWVHASDRANDILTMDPAKQTAILADEMAGVLGEININGNLDSYPLATHTANRMADDRIVLIGEAGHRLHPIGAQGFNLTARDIGELLQIIESQARLGLDIGAKKVTDKYHKQRMMDVKTRGAGIVGLITLAGANNGMLRRLHRFGLRGMKHAGPFKKMVMKAGMTGPGGLPARMQKTA